MNALGVQLQISSHFAPGTAEKKSVHSLRHAAVPFVQRSSRAGQGSRDRGQQGQQRQGQQGYSRASKNLMRFLSRGSVTGSEGATRGSDAFVCRGSGAITDCIRVPAYELLCDWLHNHGAVGVLPEEEHVAVSTFETASGDSVRGLAAQRGFGPAEEIMAIPLKCGLTCRLNKEGPGNQRADPLGWARGTQRLLHEKALGPESEWAPYLATLPTVVNHPGFWSKEEIEAVKYVPLRRALQTMRVDVEAAADKCSSMSLEDEDVAWAVANKMTRSFILRTGGDEWSVMLPFADLMNHSSTPNATWKVSDDGQVMHVITVASIRGGEQIYLSYGDRPDEGFFALYGFVPETSNNSRLHLFRDTKEVIEWYLNFRDMEELATLADEALCEDLDSYGRSKRQQLDKIVKSVKRALWRSENMVDKDTDVENFKQMSLYLDDNKRRRSLVSSILYAFELQRLRVVSSAKFVVCEKSSIHLATHDCDDEVVEAKALTSAQRLVHARCSELRETLVHELERLGNLINIEESPQRRARLNLVAIFLQSRVTLLTKLL